MKEFNGVQSPNLLLAEIARLERFALSGRRQVWFPLVAFGMVDFFGALMALIVGRGHLGPYMLPASCLAGVFCARHYRAAGTRRGVQAAVWPWIAVVLLASLVAVVCSATGREMGNRLLDLSGPTLALATGFAVLAFWAQSSVLLAVIGGLVVVTVVSVAVSDGDSAIALQLAGWSAIMTATGVVLRLRGDGRL